MGCASRLSELSQNRALGCQAFAVMGREAKAVLLLRALRGIQLWLFLMLLNLEWCSSRPF